MGEDGGLWRSAQAYESYVGRWSRLVAREFLQWLERAPGQDWVDVGCGTGELSAAVLATSEPRSVRGVDPSDVFLAAARGRLVDDRATFSAGEAQHVPFEDESADRVVAGLVLNFVPDPAAAVAEWRRVTRPGGTVAAYVWDYRGEMQMMRYFWDAAAALDPAASEPDEGRWSICRPDALAALWSDAGLADVAARAIDIPTVFADFDDYWAPFLRGNAPAPRYAMSLSEDRRRELRDLLRDRLPVAGDGSIALIARAWAVRGVRQGAAAR